MLPFGLDAWQLPEYYCHESELVHENYACFYCTVLLQMLIPELVSKNLKIHLLILVRILLLYNVPGYHTPGRNMSVSPPDY